MRTGYFSRLGTHSTFCRMLVVISILAAHVFAADTLDKPILLPTPHASRLGGDRRVLAFLSLDKPVYRPGEEVYFRLIALQENDFRPTGMELMANIQVLGPKDEKVAAFGASVIDSTAGLSWQIPPGIAGGRYRAIARAGGSAATERVFEIRTYQPPRLKTQIQFLRKGYGPGDTVTATASVTRAEGGAPVGGKITAVARVDNEEAARVENLAVDEDGVCNVSFNLPGTMDRGEGTLSILVEDGGVIESFEKTIPILLQSLGIEMYPEGGDLVAGMPGRVYVQAKRPNGKPADIEGEVIAVDEAGVPVDGLIAKVATMHEGRGILSFTPESGRQYALRLHQPSGITKLFSLPEVKESGVAIRAEKAAYAHDEPIAFTVHANHDSRAAFITLFHREKEVARAPLSLGENTIELTPADGNGVLMATVWDAEGSPLAERLVFRKPRFFLTMGVRAEAEPASATLTPGTRVRLTVEAKDEDGKPVEAMVAVTVSDDAVLEMVERRDQAPSLPVMAFLENEVLSLADAHTYFDPTNPGADRDIDLLLGIQGWRRFTLAEFDQFWLSHQERARRIFGIYLPETVPGYEVPFREGEPMPPAPPGMHWILVQKPGVYKNVKRTVTVSPHAMYQVPVPGEYLSSSKTEPIPKTDWNNVDASPRFPGSQPENGSIAHRKRDTSVELFWRLGNDPAKPGRPGEVRGSGGKSFAIVREYAHSARPDRLPNDRVDFTETLYWNTGVRTNPEDGTATVTFDLSDSVTTFRVRADAFAGNGALGAGTGEIVSLEPFHIEPKLPPAVVMGDRIVVPVALVNATANELDKVGMGVRMEGMEIAQPTSPTLLAAHSRSRVLVEITTSIGGEKSIEFNASAAAFADNISKSLTVLPRGFPTSEMLSGQVHPDESFSARLTIPMDVVPGSVTASARLMPSPIASMEAALSSLIRRPHGCFEQTISTIYPLVMAQQYFLSHPGVSPEKVKAAAEMLEAGYERLLKFECKDGGYDWFGASPGKETVTAYGLMLFTEMRKVMPVDEEMLNRTRRWLLSRRDGKGGFLGSRGDIDSSDKNRNEVDTMYILWALLESGENPESLSTELAAAKRVLGESIDSYILGLGVNVFHLAGDTSTAMDAAGRLQTAQTVEGSVIGASTSAVFSKGAPLAVETTAIAALAWLRCGNAYLPSVERAITWLYENSRGGSFRSTQATVLALKAINIHDALRTTPKIPGIAQFFIDDRPIASPQAVDDNQQVALTFPDFSAAMTPGDHTIEIRLTGGCALPVIIDVTYNTEQISSSPNCPLFLATSLSEAEVDEGELVDLNISLSAKAEDVFMPLAVIGLPAGLEPSHERLRELIAEKRIAMYEIANRELVLYWRKLASGQMLEMTIPMLAAVPGTYTAPASRAYAYYQDEHIHCIAGETVNIIPK